MRAGQIVAFLNEIRKFFHWRKVTHLSLRCTLSVEFGFSRRRSPDFPFGKVFSTLFPGARASPGGIELGVRKEGGGDFLSSLEWRDFLKNGRRLD